MSIPFEGLMVTALMLFVVLWLLRASGLTVNRIR